MTEETPLTPAPQKPESPPILKAADRVLYPSTLGMTVVILGFQLWEFFQGGAFRPRWPFAEVYLAVLTAYAAQRELSKWKNVDEPSLRLRRGELFVALWIAVWLAMTAIANLYERFTVPTELKTITLGVLGIFAVSGLSAGLRGRAGLTRAEAAGAGSSGDRKDAVLDLARKQGSVNSEDVSAALSISSVTAWRLLEALEKEGRLIQDPSSDPRNRRYRIK